MNNRDYWNGKIIEWEDSMSEKEGVPIIERLASLFRGALRHRSEMSMNILGRFVKDKTVLELGCASGFLAFELFEKKKPNISQG